jgi:hypothetical protein
MNTENIVLQGIRFRKGGDGLAVRRDAHDIVIDHCSVGGEISDGGMDITQGSHNVTVSWCIIAKVKGTPEEPGKASLIKYDAYRLSLHHNIYYANAMRNPLISTNPERSPGKKAAPPLPQPIADLRYNIVWAYGNTGTETHASYGRRACYNVVGCLFQNANPSGMRPSNHLIVCGSEKSPVQTYAAGNATVHDCRGEQFRSRLKVTSANSVSNQATPWPAPNVSGPKPDDKAGRLAEWEKVRKEAGPSNFPDDAIDAEARREIKIPGEDIFSNPWNDG